MNHDRRTDILIHILYTKHAVKKYDVRRDGLCAAAFD